MPRAAFGPPQAATMVCHIVQIGPYFSTNSSRMIEGVGSRDAGIETFDQEARRRHAGRSSLRPRRSRQFVRKDDRFIAALGELEGQRRDSASERLRLALELSQEVP